MSGLFATLELAKRIDGGSDVDVVDLADWVKIPDGWNQNTSQDDAPVDEALTLNIDETGTDSLAATLQGIDNKVKDIERSRAPNEPYGVWLRAQLAGETNERQAFLLRGKRSSQVRVSNPALLNSVLLQYTLGLTRMAGWETDAPVALPVATAPYAISAHGGMIPYDLGGDLNARVALATFGVGDDLSNFSEIWIGAKSEKYGGVNPANFVPFWGMDKHGYLDVDASVSSDTTNCVSGVKLAVSFATVTLMQMRVAIAVSAVTAHAGDQRGRYIVLLRAMTDNASLVSNVRAGRGYMYSGYPGVFSYGDSLQIGPSANSSYQYYTLGEIDLPPVTSLIDLDMNYAALAVQAEKISGSGNLLMDGLLLVPAENFVHVQAVQPIYGSFLADRPLRMRVITTPDLRYRSIVTITPSGTEYTIEQNPVDQLTWSLPPGAGAIVCGAQLTGGTTRVADLITPSFEVYSSYATLRGAD